VNRISVAVSHRYVHEDDAFVGMKCLDKGGRGGVVPRLIMRDADGRDSIEMGVDLRGDGGLASANDYWNGGALVLGHLQNVDDGTESKSKDVEDKSGAWAFG
jgi:hypothetical protein